MGFWSSIKKPFKKLGKKVNKGLTKMKLHSLKETVNAGELFRDPKKYFSDIGKGYKKDFQHGADVWGKFKGGKWGDLIKQGVTDTGSALTIKSSVVKKQAKLGETGGKLYEAYKGKDAEKGRQALADNKSLGKVSEIAAESEHYVKAAQAAYDAGKAVKDGNYEKAARDAVTAAKAIKKGKSGRTPEQRAKGAKASDANPGKLGLGGGGDIEVTGAGEERPRHTTAALLGAALVAALVFKG